MAPHIYCSLQKCQLHWWLGNLSDNSNLDSRVLGYFVTMSVWEEGKGRWRVQEPGIGHYKSMSPADNLTS